MAGGERDKRPVTTTSAAVAAVTGIAATVAAATATITTSKGKDDTMARPFSAAANPAPLRWMRRHRL
jgi:hypothetical protein